MARRGWAILPALFLGCGGLSNSQQGGGGTTGGTAGSGGTAGGSVSAGTGGTTAGTGGTPLGSAGAPDIVLCPGYARPMDALTTGEACISDASCRGGEFCRRQGEPIGCGICQGPHRECEGSGDCSHSAFCNEYIALCTCDPTAKSSRCESLCTLNGCADGEQCDTATELCGPPRCDQGYVCPVNTHCTPDWLDDHGCTPLTCTNTSECDCGLCIDGVCASGPGACSSYPL